MTQPRKMPLSFIAAGALLVGFIVTSVALPRAGEVYPKRTAFLEFPMQLGEWQGRRESMEAVFSDVLQLDDYLLADYVDDSGRAVNVYVSYYNSQRKGEAVHSPRSCLPGGGWQVRDFGQRDIRNVSINGQPLRVNRSVVEMGNQRQLVYYWFQQRGRVITNEFAVKWYLFWDALSKHRTDGSMIRLITPMPSTSLEGDADRRLTAFVSKIAPDITRYVPN